MRHDLSLALCLCLAAHPLAAQEADPAPDGESGIEEGLSLMERGSRLLFREFMERLDPQLDELSDQLGTALETLREQVGRMEGYYPPEVLPNGDIIIRRRDPAEAAPDLPVDPGDSVDL